MKIVTSGNRYIDIDAYASCIAYVHLLRMKGVPAKAVSTAKLNESITPNLLNLHTKLDAYEKDRNNEFIIIDVSNKEYFDDIVEEGKIVEVIDHHVGFEKYWKEMLGNKANIEFIGAVATLIVEIYEAEGLLDKCSKDIAYLLMAAILDNTLNFKAKVTTTRDKVAYEKLNRIVKEENYAEKYFLNCQLAIESDLEAAIANDTKIDRTQSSLPPIFGQLTVWDKQKIMENKTVIHHTLSNIGNPWMMNLICLEEGRSYIIAQDESVQQNLEKLLGGKFEKDILQLENLWLRKEIIKKAMEQ